MLSIGLVLPAIPALAQVGVEIGPGGVRVGPQRRSPYYEERPVARDPAGVRSDGPAVSLHG